MDKQARDPLDELTEAEYQQALEALDLYNRDDLTEDEVLVELEKYSEKVRKAANSVVFGLFGMPLE